MGVLSKCFQDFGHCQDDQEGPEYPKTGHIDGDFVIVTPHLISNFGILVTMGVLNPCDHGSIRKDKNVQKLGIWRICGILMVILSLLPHILLSHYLVREGLKNK